MKEFKKPELEVVEMEAVDVITASTETCVVYCDNKGADDDL